MDNYHKQTQHPHNQERVIIVGNQKSVGVAFLLAFLFGPLGLLYASVTGGIVMFVLGIIIALVTFGFGLIFVWIGCIIWAIVAVNKENKITINDVGVSANTNTNNDIPVAEQPSFQQTQDNIPHQQYQQTQLNQSKQDIGKITTKLLNDYGNWVTNNLKGLFIGAGSILGLAILIVLIKFILSLDFNNSTSVVTPQLVTSTPIIIPEDNPNTIVSSKEKSMIENKYIIDYYLGTLGNKDFKLFIEKVEGEVVEGYNVTGTNRRPVKGRIVNKWTEPTGFGGNYTIYKLILTEPGDDTWDGEFNIDLWISDIGRHGNGYWKSYNGKLERTIKIKDRFN